MTTLSPEAVCLATSGTCPTMFEDRMTLENLTFEPGVQAMADTAIEACKQQAGCALECKHLVDFAKEGLNA